MNNPFSSLKMNCDGFKDPKNDAASRSSMKALTEAVSTIEKALPKSDDKTSTISTYTNAIDPLGHFLMGKSWSATSDLGICATINILDEMFDGSYASKVTKMNIKNHTPPITPTTEPTDATSTKKIKVQDPCETKAMTKALKDMNAHLDALKWMASKATNKSFMLQLTDDVSDISHLFNAKEVANDRKDLVEKCHSAFDGLLPLIEIATNSSHQTEL